MDVPEALPEALEDDQRSLGSLDFADLDIEETDLRILIEDQDVELLDDQEQGYMEQPDIDGEDEDDVYFWCVTLSSALTVY